MRMYKDARDAGEVDGGTVKGYASTWDREPDAYGDVIAKGAFADSLKRWEDSGKPIPLLYGHNTNDPEYNIGRVTLAREDERGLYVEAEFDPENEKAQYVRKLVKEGRLYQFSFAFELLDRGEVELDGGVKANELRKLDIFEVSLVQIPANQHAEVVEVKAAPEADVEPTQPEPMGGAEPERGEKSGRRNSKADEGRLIELREHILEALTLADAIIGDPGDAIGEGQGAETEGGEGDASPKGREESAEMLALYKKAVIETFGDNHES